MSATQAFVPEVREDRDSTLVFYVRSANSKVEYIVDLEAEDGWGACNCPDFQFRVFGHRRATKDMFAACKHIRLAQVKLARKVAKWTVKNRDARKVERLQEGARRVHAPASNLPSLPQGEGGGPPSHPAKVARPGTRR